MKLYSVSRLLLFAILIDFDLRIHHLGELFVDAAISDQDASEILAMKLKNYYLQLLYPDRHKVEAKRQFGRKQDALCWAQLCLDICGKDGNGVRYSYAILFDENEKPVKEYR